MVKNSFKKSDLKNKSLDNNNMKSNKCLAKYTKFVSSIDYYKSVLPKKYRSYFDVVTSLYLDRKIEKQSEVHKLLTKLIGRGTAPKSAIKLIDTYSQREPITGIKTKDSIFLLRWK